MKSTTRPYKTIIPVKLPIEHLEQWGEEYAKLANENDAELFVIIRNVFGDRARFTKELDDLKRKVDFFAARGVSVGAWLCPTTGHEGMGLVIGEDGKRFTRRQVADYSTGEPRLIGQAFCPLDEGFTVSQPFSSQK